MAIYGFEIHPNTEIAKSNLPIFSDEEMQKKVRTCIEFFSKNPKMVWHCGGQDPQTMLDREQQKKQLNRK